ncbi:MAG: chromosome partitioning protein ParB [Candidatus Magasanikbacteria bacterium CG_4_10_14_0_2_um_filter_37_12]|uniref:Chromosome partitioning protein ParB n=1 Tax=Candidatus Magasanikbacteria bacterium CG_4_10_14_0_2_um_filter_37_12 TaxID=1974637 RepID=A0A2M7V7L1_9BACT|nr:MAG: chromosome partitioning protein ParB [Candidatus Magasanikbacteria bacterium CG_4_10_14_0_2_um_filter_37_12]
MALGKGLNSLIPQSGMRKIIRKETGSDEQRHDRILHIPLSEVVPNSEQPRKNFDHKEIEDLVQSIKKHGILQPITVTEREDGGYELIAGERRLRSAGIAGLMNIPAIVRSATRQEKLELALIENIQRQNLDPVEEAFAYQRLIEEFGMTQQEVSEQVGKSRSAIANTIRLLELPDEIQKALVDGRLNVGKARALLSLKNEKEQMQVFGEMVGQKATVRDVERAVASKGQQSRKGSVRRDPNVRATEQLIEDRLGSPVHITQKGERGTIVIEYHSKGELKRIVEELT